MDRSRHQGTTGGSMSRRSSEDPPRVRPSAKAGPNRRKPLAPQARWYRLVSPKVAANACGRALRRLSTIAVALAGLSAVSGVAWAGYHFATTSPRFAIRSIAVQGNQHVTEQQVLAALRIEFGDNVFRVDLDEAVHLLRSDPWIASANAHRVLPNTIRVDIAEHQPVAVADLGGLYLVNATGRPFKRAVIETGEAMGLPVVTGITRARYTENPEETEQRIRSALRALDSWRAEAGRPSIGEVTISPFGALTFRTYDVATAIQLGVPDAELPQRFQSFDTTWAELGEAERARARAIHIDSHSDHVTVAFAKDQ